MAWEATYWLPLVLLILLASGSWEQQLLVQKLEGETVFVTCPYSRRWEGWRKVWCRQMAQTCTPLVTQPRFRREPEKPRYFIQDVAEFSYFKVTMTELRMNDSGVYRCELLRNPYFQILGTITLVVSVAPTLPTTTRTTRRTTALISATSPPDHRAVIWSVTTVLLLLVVLTGLMILYWRRARGRARTGKDKSHIYDITTNKDETVSGKDGPARQRESQLSWGSNQWMGSGDIHYASLIHLNDFGPEDAIYVNTRPSPKPAPDPFLAAEYASIGENRSQPSKLAALKGEPGI